MAQKITLSEDQQLAFDSIAAWLKDSQKTCMTLGGYAGTGKSTLMAQVAKELAKDVTFLAPTGKACQVLQGKGVTAQTVHSFCYKSFYDKKQRRYVNELRDDDDESRLIIVDEASMVTRKMFEDIGRRISPETQVLYVGDHGQLPPVNCDFNLMANPDVRLEKIHRQAAENPIIRLSEQVRQPGYVIQGGELNGEMGWSVGCMGQEQSKRALDNRFEGYCLICWDNRTRVALNGLARRHMGFLGIVEKGERIIALENDDKQQVCNGQMIRVSKIGDATRRNVIVFDEEGTRFKFGRQAFGVAKPGPSIEQRLDTGDDGIGPNADYGYCVTCHKAQGSQFETVAIKLNRQAIYCLQKNNQWERWIYTAVTRAEKRLFIDPGE